MEIDRLPLPEITFSRLVLTFYSIFQYQLAPEVSDALVDSYFTHFNQVFPVLSRPHFVDQMKQGPASVDPLLLNAVYATGAQYCRVTKPDMPVNADFFITRCRVLLEENSEEATMSRLQVNTS